MSKLTQIFWDLINSFKTTDGGFAARKLSAFVGVMTAMGISWRQSTPENAFMLICANYTFALLCLGLVTASQLIYFKTGQKQQSNT